jgi:uncharacterized repeat protein (TIGR01451 family)
VVGTTVTLPIISNDSLSDGSPIVDITKITVDLNPALPGIQDTLVVAGQGTFVYNPITGNVKFTPEVGFTTDPSPINYTLIENATGLDSTATIVITYVEEPPVAVNDSSLNNVVGTTVTLPIISNDSLSDGSPIVDITKITVDLNPALPGIQDTLVVAGQGTFVYNPITGNVKFTPEIGFTTDPSPINYTLIENATGLDSTATIVITYVEEPPVAVNDSSLNNVVGTTVTLPIISNDSLSDGSPIVDITKITVDLNPALPGIQDTLVVAGQGTFVYNPITGNVKFTPEVGFYGQPTPIDYVLIENASGLSDTAKIVIRYQEADLNLVLRVDKANVVVGDTVTFTVVVKNDGPTNATNVKVGNYIPNGYSIITNISNAGILTNDTLTWSGLNIPVGDSIVLTYKAKVLAPTNGTNYINLAEITYADQFDPDSKPNNGSDTNNSGGIGSQDNDDSKDLADEDDGDDARVYLQVADLSLSKVVNIVNPAIGQKIKFTVTVSNAGADTATNVAVTDYLQNGYSNFTNISNGGILVNNKIVWNIPMLAVNDSLVLTFEATVNAPSDTTIYKNEAEITALDQLDTDSKVFNFTGTVKEDDEAIVCVLPVTIPDTVTICEGGKLNVQPFGGVSYAWVGPNGYTSLAKDLVIDTVSISNGGIYRLSVTNALGCNVTSLLRVIVDPKPIATLEAINSGCVGDSSLHNGKIRVTNYPANTKFQVSKGAVFNESTASTIAAIPADGVLLRDVANPITTQDYTVRIWNNNGCFKDYTVEFVNIQCVCKSDVWIPINIKKSK